MKGEGNVKHVERWQRNTTLRSVSCIHQPQLLLRLTSSTSSATPTIHNHFDNDTTFICILIMIHFFFVLLSRWVCGGGPTRLCFLIAPHFPLSLPFCFQCRRARSQYPKDPHQGGLRVPGACSFWSAPLHTYPILFVCRSFMAPHFVRCCLTPNFFFPAPPHPPTPLLG